MYANTFYNMMVVKASKGANLQEVFILKKVCNFKWTSIQNIETRRKQADSPWRWLGPCGTLEEIKFN